MTTARKHRYIWGYLTAAITMLVTGLWGYFLHGYMIYTFVVHEFPVSEAQEQFNAFDIFIHHPYRTLFALEFALGGVFGLSGILIALKKPLGWYLHYAILLLSGFVFLITTIALISMRMSPAVGVPTGPPGLILLGLASTFTLFFFGLIWFQQRYWQRFLQRSMAARTT